MTDPKLVEALAKHNFTKGLSEKHRMQLAEGAEPFAADAGEYLFQEHEHAGSFYLIQSGHVEIGSHLAERGNAVIQRIGGGDVVGWSWLLPPFRWQFDARAVDNVAGLSFDATWLREQCERDHDLGYHLLKELVAVISSRLSAARLQRMDIYR